MLMACLMRGTNGMYGDAALCFCSHCSLSIAALTTEVCCRDMSVDDAIELGQRSIYHATFRDAVSGGTVSGKLSYTLRLIRLFVTQALCDSSCILKLH